MINNPLAQTPNPNHIPHRSLKRPDGSPVMFIEATQEPCPGCNPTGHREGRVLGVLSRDKSKTSETVGCLVCDTTFARPYTPPIRPMNSGGYR